MENICYKLKNNKGITLTTLVVTIIVLLILAGVATSTGIEAIENSKHTKFVAELKIMQSYVNQWYEDCKPNSNETFEGNIANKFIAINATNATEDEKAQTTLTNANVLSAEFGNFYLLEDDQKNALGIEGVSQKVLVSVKNRKVVSYDGLKWKNKMYYTIDDQSGEGLDEIYNVEYQNPNTNAPTIKVTGKSVYYGDTAKNAKYRFNVDVTQGSNYINKGDLYYGKKENGSVRNWKKTVDNTFLVDREGTYQFYYKDAAGNVSNVIDYVIEPKTTLINGLNFNQKMKILAGDTSATVSSSNTNITELKIAQVKPNNNIINDDNYKISTNNSQYPVYMWCENNTILLWSEENWINLTDMTYMFQNMKEITHIDLYEFDTSNVVGMGQLFMGCYKLTNLDLSGFDTSNVVNMYAMFFGCLALNNLNVSSFNTNKVTNMGLMFDACTALTKLDLRNFDTSNVTNMYAMFYNCSNLNSLNISNFNTIKVTNMQSMFQDCSQLANLDLSSFDTSKVTNMFRMFWNCPNLERIYVSENFVTTALTNDNVISGNNVIGTNSSHLFYGCTQLVGGKGTPYNSSNVNSNYAHIDGGTSNPGYFTRKE